MKKFFNLFILIIVISAMLAGCSQGEKPVDESENYFDSNVIFDRDAKEHWQNDENGEKLNSAPHEIDELNTCVVCRSEIIDWGDGTIDVMNYDGFYSLVRRTSYDAEGNVISDCVYEYEYDENGNYKYMKFYENGVLCSEAEYTVTEDGFGYAVWEIVYGENGAYDLSEYNENGNISKFSNFDENGELVYESLYEYSLDSEGWEFNSKTTEIDYAESKKSVYQYNEYSDTLSYSEYDLDGTLVYEETYDYEYDEQGRTTYKAMTVNGTLAEEIYFGFVEEDDGWYSYYKTYVSYEDDNTKHVFEYDENEELISETIYDADGNIIE